MNPNPTPAQIAYEAWVRSKESPSLPPTPAQIAYAAYGAVMAPLAPWGTPAFAELPDLHQRAWEAVASAVLDAWQAQPRAEVTP